MPSREPARPAPRRPRSGVLVAVVVGAALLGAVISPSLAPASPSLASQTPVAESPVAASPVPAPSMATPPGSPPIRPAAGGRDGERAGALGMADGAVPDGVTVHDGGVPAVARLDPALLGALRDAAADAADEGITFAVTSGWRSPAYQAQLLREAVSTYGSEAEAARWVASPTTSAHVSGDAVDLGSDAAQWLSRHGARYGLCPVYDNEPWHHELRPDAVGHGCPPTYADPTHDPRMQRR